MKAYCVWADAGEIETVKGLFKLADASKRMFEKEQVSAAACAALVRLDPKAAVDAINARLENDMFRTQLLSQMNRLSKVDGPAQARASDISNQLMASHGRSKIVLQP